MDLAGYSVQLILSSGGIMILILLSCFGNVLVCFAVYYSRNLRARVNYLIVSLAIADILIATICMPVWIVFEITSFAYLSHEDAIRLSRFWTFMDILGGIASIANLTAISYERFWSVFSPLKHRRYLTNITVGAIIVCVWAYAVFVATTTVYWENWEGVIIYNAVVGFFLPLFLIFAAYVSIVIIVNKSPRNVISSQDNTRINRTIFIIVTLFTICWAPHFIASILSLECSVCFHYFKDNLWIRSLFKWLHYFNSCLNPLVYGIANVQYKEAFKTVFKKMCFPCLFKANSQDELPQRPVYYPARRQSDTSKALFVELTPEDKEEEGARGGFHAIRELNEHEYLPGDYRAIPTFLSHGETRWSDAQDTLLTPSELQESAALKEALLNPESLSRTSYI